MTFEHTHSSSSDERTAQPSLPPLDPGLYLVATPIGNLEDITYRAVRVLKSCDRILAEDTRHSRVLLDHYGIRKPLEPYHDFNKEKVTASIVQRLRDGDAIALICDAGTPGIADPAFNLVKAALAEAVIVYSIPGPSALLAAITASGLPTDRFSFENFPPKKSAQRIHKLERLKERWREDENHAPTLGFYVAPYQILSFLGEIAQVFGPETYVVAARELTKKFEEFRRGPVSELVAHYTKTTPRGEFVVLFHPQDKR
jgi:16S rRNA (cytidine1402-2'-O)-methyltransferase